MDIQRTGTPLDMTHKDRDSRTGSKVVVTRRPTNKRPRRRLFSVAGSLVGGIAVLITAGSFWVAVTATQINEELQSATQLVSGLKNDIALDRPEDAIATVEKIRSHTHAARERAGDPLWTLASVVPGFGANLSAVSEVARAADDVANLGLVPLAKVFRTLDWEKLVPSGPGTDIKPLKAASPSVKSAALAVRLSAERLDRIDSSKLLPQVAEPLQSARDQLHSVTGALDTASDASQIIPTMLGSEEPRRFLLVIQNNAEARASGGIPGALAVLNLYNGNLTLSSQTSAAALGVTSPTLPLDPEQQTIYSARLGKYMQDVNLTPDFPSAAATAQLMWEGKTGQRVDGVISIDPVALSYILDATGPVELASPELSSLAGDSLPAELSGSNVVKTLLSDVYAKIQEPKLQDLYFAGIAQEIFGALSSGKADTKLLLEGMTRAAQEGRLLIWSSLPTEQELISKYPISGSIAGRGVAPAQFGVYFNDGTGAKMDYYMKRSVQLVKECAKDGYEQMTVRITSTNTAPADADTSLPAYVTGAGIFGVPPGSVQTNLVAYGPVQAQVETAKIDGNRSDFAPYLHSNRPVGVLALRLAPGETKTVEFTFGKIVQHAEPNLVVTPTVLPVKEVTLPTEEAVCG